jgi:hypothetical protein
MELSPEGIVGYIIEYTKSLPSAIMQGDIFALTIGLIAFFIAVVIINQLTALLVRFLKRAILLIIVTLAFIQFFLTLSSRVAAEGWTMDSIVFGAIGTAVGIVAIITALMVALGEYHSARKKPVHPNGNGKALHGTPRYETPYEAHPEPTAVAREEFHHAVAPPHGDEFFEEYHPAQVTAPAGQQPVALQPDSAFAVVKEGLSFDNIKQDRSLGTVIAYLIVAQFGVFSSASIPAPSFQVGLAFFILFILAGLIFIHFTYNNYVTGLRHLFIGLVVGGIVALLLGYFWGNIPLSVLLSPAFFQTNALVALVTGLALSLFIGGKG